jgi:hypothetical protein
MRGAILLLLHTSAWRGAWLKHQVGRYLYILLALITLIILEEVRGTYNILVGKAEGRRPLGRPRRR